MSSDDLGRTSADRLTVREVVISPYSDLLQASYGTHDHRGGPDWPDWDAQTFARHNRMGSPVDERPIDVAPVDRMSGRFAWGGAITGHFGHQVADFSMRLMATLDAEPDVTIAFASHPRYGDWSRMDDTPVFARQILDWLGVPLSHCLLVAQPTIVESLSVWPQAEQHHGPGPSPAHLSRMDALVTRNLSGGPGGAGVLYVSRSNMHARMGGERYIEQAMRDAGARVIQPETLPLRQQLQAYVAADTAIFPEGSAVQSVRLLGRSLGHVVILRRRPGDRIAEDALQPRARSLRYLDALVGVVSGLTDDGEPFEVLGLPILDAAVLVEELSVLVPGLRVAWDEAAWQRARDADVMAWLERSLASPRVRGDRSWQFILARLEATGLGHLIAPAKAMMDERGQPPEAVPAPQSGTSRRAEPEAAEVLDRVGRVIGAEHYLEIGVGTAQTLRKVTVDRRTGVDPRPLVPDAVRAAAGTAIVAASADEFFSALPPDERFDLAYVDGDLAFDQAYRDVLQALRHMHARSVLVLAGTWPGHKMATNGPQEVLRAQRPVGNAGVRACGGAYQVAALISDQRADLAVATVAAKRGPITLWWRSDSHDRRVVWGTTAAIEALSVEEYQAHAVHLKPVASEAVVRQIEIALGPIA